MRSVARLKMSTQSRREHMGLLQILRRMLNQHWHMRVVTISGKVVGESRYFLLLAYSFGIAMFFLKAKMSSCGIQR